MTELFSSIMAGAIGIEPILTVLETAVLPLYDAPNSVMICALPIKNYKPRRIELTRDISTCPT